MGCCASNFIQHRSAHNISDALNDEDEAYVPAGQRLSSKRSYASRLSMAASSGVFSRCSTPSKRSIMSRCSSTPSRAPTPKPKPNLVNYHDCHKKQNMPNIFQMLSICDDFCDAEVLAEQQLGDSAVDKSCGYFTRSLNTPTSSNDNSPITTPSKSPLCYTQGHCAEVAALDTTLPKAKSRWDLEMEMYMMSHAENFMPKTSSPIFYRRNITVDMPPIAAPASASYEKWRNYLQHTPAYMTNNITRIPEAIAGQFSPASFPAFSDLDEMESAPKRYKVDVHQLSACNRTCTIITTEL